MRCYYLNDTFYSAENVELIKCLYFETVYFFFFLFSGLREWRVVFTAIWTNSHIYMRIHYALFLWMLCTGTISIWSGCHSENVWCLMMFSATQWIHGIFNAFRLRTFDCLCRSVEYLFILFIYLSIRLSEKEHFQFNTFSLQKWDKKPTILRTWWVADWAIA